jgi:hypothetical protein
MKMHGEGDDRSCEDVDRDGTYEPETKMHK